MFKTEILNFTLKPALPTAFSISPMATLSSCWHQNLWNHPCFSLSDPTSSCLCLYRISWIQPLLFTSAVTSWSEFHPTLFPALPPTPKFFLSVAWVFFCFKGSLKCKSDHITLLILSSGFHLLQKTDILTKACKYVYIVCSFHISVASSPIALFLPQSVQLPCFSNVLLSSVSSLTAFPSNLGSNLTFSSEDCWPLTF